MFRISCCILQSLVALLIQYGADVGIVNGEGATPKDVAIGKEVVDMLAGN